MQSHYIEVAQGGSFIEQKMRFGLVKKFGADYEQLLRPVFLKFSWAKNKLNFFFENIVAPILKSYIE